MDAIYKKAIQSDTIQISDPATRKPLYGDERGVGIRPTDDKSKVCAECKWGVPDVNIPTVGHCHVMKNQVGAIWRRRVAEYYGMTCDMFTAGDVDFRDHV